MNLTYDDFCGGNADRASWSNVASTHAIAVTADMVTKTGMKGDGLSGFFSSLASGVKTLVTAPAKATIALVTHGTNAMMDQINQDAATQKKNLVGIASIAAPIVGAFTYGIGGAAIKLAASKFESDQNKKKAVASAAGQGNAALIQEYAPIAGSVPGRVFGLDNMRKVMNAAFDQGAIPGAPIDAKGTRKVWGNMAVDFIDATGGKCVTSKYACPEGLLALARANPTATAAQIVDRYAASSPIHAPEIRSGLERQIFIDAADAALTEINPNAALSYGYTQADLEKEAPQAPTSNDDWVQIAVENQFAPFTGAQDIRYGANGKWVVKNVAAQNGGIPCSNDIFGDPIVGTVKACYSHPMRTTNQLPSPVSVIPQATRSPAPAPRVPPQSQALTQSGVSAQTSDQVNQMLAAMKQQGANQSQMLDAALAALKSQGVNTQAPAVQQAVAADVAQVQTAGVSNIPGWLLPILAGGAVIFALTMNRGGPSNSRAFSPRKTNPRRRRGRK